MPLPLVWIGAAVAGALVVDKIKDNAEKEEKLRRTHKTPESKHSRSSSVAKSPGTITKGDVRVTPVRGSVVTCSIYELFDHSGIWIDEDTVIELHGSGLVRAVSPARFLENRSGEQIHVACDSMGEPIVIEGVAERATQSIFQYREYDVVENNCHRFIGYCLRGYDSKLTLFSSLNDVIADLSGVSVYWDRTKKDY